MNLIAGLVAGDLIGVSILLCGFIIVFGVKLLKRGFLEVNKKKDAEIAQLRVHLDAHRVSAKSLESKLRTVRLRHSSLLLRINRKGGEAFLREGSIHPHRPTFAPTSQQFSKNEIMSLIKLCHPDRHGNSEPSNKLTAILIKMR
jgi:hypothetical protein